jgi:hypothetical protein
VRSVRVFLSSTFLDMQEEREELIRRTFPALREGCEARGVNWGEVDLRWGVTRAQAEKGLALPICLAEIDECRPFFLAILGERYGWVPDAIGPELVARYPWLDGLTGRSVTELEIRHGALNGGPGAALFYFRDPSWLDRFAGAERARYQTAEPEGRRRLDELKAAVVTSGHPVRVYRDPTELGPMVVEDMTRLLERLLPAAAADRAERDASAQEALICRLSAGHVGREAELRALDDHARGLRAPAGLVVTGEPGSGKSSMMARWVTQLVAGGPAKPGSPAGAWRFLRRGLAQREVFVYHFAGASADSSGVPVMLRWLVGRLSCGTVSRREAPADPIGMSAAFAGALAAAAAEGRVILALDGLDRVDRRGQGLDLAWLPDPLPPGVRAVVSAGPGPVLGELTRRGWRALALAPVDRSGRAAFISAYLRSNHHKVLDRDESDAVAAVEAGSNSLFLRTFLEELVAGAQGIEDLPGLIRRYSAASGTADLFDLMLARLEGEHDRERPGLVGEAVGMLWASRHGLTDREAEELLGPEGRLLPSAVWVPLRHALRPFTVSGAGLTRLPEDGLRPAVERRYLADPAARAAAHRRLACYFGQRPMSDRVVEELPWQLSASGQFGALARLLADPRFLQAAWPRHRYEVASYWQAVEARTAVRRTDALVALADAPAPAALAAAQLLADSGRRAEALLVARRQADGSGGLAALDLAAGLAAESGDLEAALALSARQEEVARSAGDADARLAALAQLAAVERRLAAIGRAAPAVRAHEQAALRHLDEAERLAAWVGAGDRVADLLGQRARWLEGEGRHSEALALCRRRAGLYRQLGDLAGLQDTAAHRGRLLAALRRSSEALAALGEAEALARRLNDPSALQACLGDLADVQTARRRLDEALVAIAEREGLCRDVLHDPCALALTLLQKANLFGAVMRQPALGLDVVKQAEAMAAEAGCAEALARAAAVRAAILAAGLRPDV